MTKPGSDSELSEKLSKSQATTMLTSVLAAIVLGALLGSGADTAPDVPPDGYPAPAPEDPPGQGNVSHVHVILTNYADNNISIALSVWYLNVFSVGLAPGESSGAILENVTGDMLAITWTDGEGQYASTLGEPLVDGWTLRLDFFNLGQMQYEWQEGQPV